MVNPNNETNQENTSFYDQSDGKFNKAIQNANAESGAQKGQKLAAGVTSDDDDEVSGSTDYSKNLMNRAEQQVRENEDASLQDDSYSFDEDNTDTEEYHDADDAGHSYDFDNDDDFVQ